MRRFWSVMNTTAARLSALYLMMFAIGSVFLIVYMTSMAARFVITETRNGIIDEINDLNRVYERGGMRALVRIVEGRARAPGANLYILSDAAGRILSGNVYAIQPGTLDDTGWIRETFAYAKFGEDQDVLGEGGKASRAVAHVMDLPNGMRMLVGRDIGEPERFRKVVRQALTMALLMMGFGALLIWFFVGRRALKRIDGMSKASARIMSGDLTGRLPVSAANDEFDRLSASLNAMLERIALLNDGLRDVSDSIAHDLKTPLTRLRNKAAQAMSSSNDVDALKTSVADIMSEADQLISIFNALLLISRVESGYTKQELHPVDLAAIATDMAELFGPIAEDAGFEFVTDIDGPAIAAGNRELIGQAITNLIENALKYGQSESGQSRLEITVGTSRSEVTVTVRDHGAGIAADQRDHVTKRFVRLDSSRAAPGSGLGLSLVAAIMSLHGAKMALNDGNPGLVVTLSFPPATK